MYSSIFLASLLACLPACSDASATKGDAEPPSQSEDGDADTDDGPDDEAEPPDAWTLRASLLVSGGVPSVEGATAEVELLASGEVSCTAGIDTAGIAAGTSDEPAVYAWWTLPLVAVEDECVLAGVPASIGLGVGELHPEVRARLGSAGYDTVADSLYGAYLATDLEPEAEIVYVYGFAGTDSDLAGDDAASAPLPDGDYALEPLFVFDLATVE